MHTTKRFLHPICRLLLFTLLTTGLAAATISDAVNGDYVFAAPERGASKATIQFGQLGNKYALAVAKGPGIPPAVYTFMLEESKTLKTAVFSTMTLYVLQYDLETFVIVQADGVLGRKVWQNLAHVNIYSKNPETIKKLGLDGAKTFALDLSKKIMNQEVGAMAHAAGTYHLAVPMEHLGKKRASYEITFIDEPGKKQLDVVTVPGKGPSEYVFLPEESAMTGVDVYRHATSYYLFDVKDGVLLYTFANAGGFGKNAWSSSSSYNVLSNNQAYTRKVLTSKDLQQKIDDTMAGYFAAAKTAREQQAAEAAAKATDERRLPARGLTDPDLDQAALAAAKRWATAWSWKEDLKAAYITSKDWTITRNPLSGIITGRTVRGIVTMVHPDGRHRYQHVAFRQGHDGTTFVNLQMSGVGPIFEILPAHMVVPQ